MSKKRVYDLAKDYGMKGPELAELLKKLGFEKVKTHMTQLDDADLIQVEAMLEASGRTRAGVAMAAESAAVVEEAVPGLPRKKSLPPPVAKETGAAPVRKKLPAKEEPPAEAPAPSRVEHAVPKKKVLGAPPETAAEAPVAPAPPAQAAEPKVEAPARKPIPAARAAEAPARPAPKEPKVEPAAARPVEPPRVEAPAPLPPLAPLEVEPAPAPAATPEPAPAAAEAPAPAAAAPEPTPVPEAVPAEEGGPVKRLLVPQARAKVVGRIELPQETIRDATRRSAPATRDPGGVDRRLRQIALQNTQSRTATRLPGTTQRRGPSTSSGAGRRDGGSRGGGRRGGRSLTSTIDPNKIIEVEPPLTMKRLSEAMGVKVNELIATLTFKLGVKGKSINSILTQEEVELVAMELGRNIQLVEHKEAEEELFAELGEAAEAEEQFLRPPVVTFMGHVDHGKTSLLDALRRSDVAAHEAGGITQHIGAYRVTTQKGQTIVVLDTPGHAAFTAMRARGASLTDIVVLVVAADDGVKPQTIEAIDHARAAEVPIVVAINKCDKPQANPMQVRQQLAVKGLQPEEWGGDTQMIEVSALTGQGLDDLVERIMLVAEAALELKSRPSAAGKGTVVEVKQTPEQGVVVNVLVTDGTLRVKDRVICGNSYARVRTMIDDHGRQIAEAGPATPVQILGLDTPPQPGDHLYVVTEENEKKAREVIEDRERRTREAQLAERTSQTLTLETLSAALAAKNIKEIKLIVKADVMGSLEPLRKVLGELSTPEVKLNIIHAGLGGITETDVALGEASKAILVGFNSVPDAAARQAAERGGVDIRFYDIIYNVVDDMRLAMEGLLAPEKVEKILGHAEIRAVFKSSKAGNIAGCYVNDGLINRNAKVRVIRDGKLLYTGGVASLKRLKDDVREVKAGFECGLVIDGFSDVREGDKLEFYEVELVKRTLGSA
ncbi:MAG: translation initiation factor IF-2 [Planctomycetes bacterium]|nr:translation initiation factor IF-2 [Planctomycetota bacterium]